MKTLDETQSHEPMLLSLRILRRLFRAHINEAAGRQAQFHTQIDGIKALLLTAIKHPTSTKISVEGLRVAGSFLNTLRSAETGAIDGQYAEISQEFYTVMEEKLNNNLNPGAIKQQSIISSAQLLSACHTTLEQPQVQNVLNIYDDRLK